MGRQSAFNYVQLRRRWAWYTTAQITSVNFEQNQPTAALWALLRERTHIISGVFVKSQVPQGRLWGCLHCTVGTKTNWHTGRAGRTKAGCRRTATRHRWNRWSQRWNTTCSAGSEEFWYQTRGEFLQKSKQEILLRTRNNKPLITQRNGRLQAGM